ncbi:IS3 family transposase [Streptomyces violascens]|uniref:IS3 family transposase n=1 Tax=Streptomyces violascens TaxID=67381 RepID=UPI00365641BE
MRDEELKERIQEVLTSNYRVYGARKIWRELNRQGHAVARCTVERLMRELGITGAVRAARRRSPRCPAGRPARRWPPLRPIPRHPGPGPGQQRMDGGPNCS